MSISKVWKSLDSLAHFKLGNRERISFWNDPWIDNCPLKLVFPRLFSISSSPNGSVLDFWDVSQLSWNIFFCWLLKEEEILDL